MITTVADQSFKSILFLQVTFVLLLIGRLPVTILTDIRKIDVQQYYLFLLKLNESHRYDKRLSIICENYLLN